ARYLVTSSARKTSSTRTMKPVCIGVGVLRGTARQKLSQKVWREFRSKSPKRHKRGGKLTAFCSRTTSHSFPRADGNRTLPRCVTCAIGQRRESRSDR